MATFYPYTRRARAFGGIPPFVAFRRNSALTRLCGFQAELRPHTPLLISGGTPPPHAPSHGKLLLRPHTPLRIPGGTPHPNAFTDFRRNSAFTWQAFADFRRNSAPTRLCGFQAELRERERERGRGRGKVRYVAFGPSWYFLDNYKYPESRIS